MKRIGIMLIGVVILISAGFGVAYFTDQDSDIGEYRGVIDGFDPLSEPGKENLVEKKGVIPAHALAIANIVSKEPLGEEFSDFTDYFIKDVRKGGYYIVVKQSPHWVGGETPEIVINNQTGQVIQIGTVSGM